MSKLFPQIGRTYRFKNGREGRVVEYTGSRILYEPDDTAQQESVGMSLWLHAAIEDITFCPWCGAWPDATSIQLPYCSREHKELMLAKWEVSGE